MHPLSPRDGRSLLSACYVLPGLRFLRIQVRHMDCGRGRVAPVLPRVVGDKALSSGESDFCTAKWRGPCSRVPLTVSRTCEKQQPRALKTALGCCFCPLWIWARRPRWSAFIPDCWWSCCSAERKGFLSDFLYNTEISAFLSAALAFCSQLW